MSHSFKKGDRVRIASSDPTDSYDGKVGTVCEPIEEDRIFVFFEDGLLSDEGGVEFYTDEVKAVPFQNGRPDFKDGDRVVADVHGDGSEVVSGRIVGISFDHIVKVYIVLFDEKLREYPWSAAPIPGMFLKPEGAQ